MKKPNLEGRIELDEVLAKAKESTTNFINHLEAEEEGERIESVDVIRNQMVGDKKSSDIKKNRFIQEMKNGIGADIKSKRGYGVKVHKPTRMERFKYFLINLYSKF